LKIFTFPAKLFSNHLNIQQFQNTKLVCRQHYFQLVICKLALLSSLLYRLLNKSFLSRWKLTKLKISIFPHRKLHWCGKKKLRIGFCFVVSKWSLVVAKIILSLALDVWTLNSLNNRRLFLVLSQKRNTGRKDRC